MIWSTLWMMTTIPGMWWMTV